MGRLRDLLNPPAAAPAPAPAAPAPKTSYKKPAPEPAVVEESSNEEFEGE